MLRGALRVIAMQDVIKLLFHATTNNFHMGHLTFFFFFFGLSTCVTFGASCVCWWVWVV